MDESEKFLADVRANIHGLGSDQDLQNLSRTWIREAARYRYSYNFSWLGRPIIQHPQDIVAMQEIVWQVRPDLIVETGIAHGGSLILYASLLELLGGDGLVLGVDIDIRTQNRAEIEQHPMSRRIKMIQGSSLDAAVVRQVREDAKGKRVVLVVLDSNHTHAHVLKELELYSPLVTKGSYLVVFDTVIEDLPDDFFPDRPWGKGNNPKTAVHEFLRKTQGFEIDRTIQHKLLITVAPDGYLKRIAD